MLAVWCVSKFLVEGNMGFVSCYCLAYMISRLKCVPRIIVLEELSYGKMWNFRLWLLFYRFYIYIAMSNQELVDAGMKRMDETDQAIERSKQVSYRNKCITLSLWCYISSNIWCFVSGCASDDRSWHSNRIYFKRTGNANSHYPYFPNILMTNTLTWKFCRRIKWAVLWMT